MLILRHNNCIMDKEDFNEIKTKFEKESKRKEISKFLNYTSILVAGLGATLVSTSLIDGLLNGPNVEVVNNTEAKILEDKISKLQFDLNKSNHTIDSMCKIRDTNSKIVDNNFKIRELNIQMQTLNKYILDNPEKVISVPLLKVEIEHLKEQNEKDIKSIKDDISRVYDITKWIIGLVFTMLVSIIVLNISNLFAKNKKD